MVLEDYGYVVPVEMLHFFSICHMLNRLWTLVTYIRYHCEN